MIAKKPAIVLTSYNSLLSSQNFHTSLNSSTSSTAKPHRSPRKQRRWYATAQDGKPSHDPSTANHWVDNWPDSRHPHQVPTPYQILEHKRGQTYTKLRFTELVKLYHPDRCDHPVCRHIPDAVRLERYRLIVAAHAILSDPSKRSAYDAYGAGWGVHENHVFKNGGGREDAAPSHGPESCMNNATWEDWERWHRKYGPNAEEGAQDPQKPVYLSNTAFISVVVMMAALGGIGQATRAESSSKTFMAMRNSENERAAAELRKVREAAAGWTREERIEMFLRTRDPDAFEDEGLRKALLEPDVCDSGGMTIRNKDSDFRRRYSETGINQNPELHRPRS